MENTEPLGNPSWWVYDTKGNRTEMEHMKADVDGKSTDCRCCDRPVESKHITVCDRCAAAGCNPNSRFCMAPDLDGDA